MRCLPLKMVAATVLILAPSASAQQDVESVFRDDLRLTFISVPARDPEVFGVGAIIQGRGKKFWPSCYTDTCLPDKSKLLGEGTIKSGQFPTRRIQRGRVSETFPNFLKLDYKGTRVRYAEIEFVDPVQKTSAAKPGWSATSLAARLVPQVQASQRPSGGAAVWKPVEGSAALEVVGLFTIARPIQSVETTQIGVAYETRQSGQALTREHEMIGFAFANDDGSCGPYEFPGRLLGGSYTVKARGVEYTVAHPVKDGPGQITMSEGARRLCFCFAIPKGIEGPFTLRLIGAKYRIGRAVSP